MTDSDITRRRALALGGVAGGAALGIGLTSCSSDSESDGSSSVTASASASASAASDTCVLNSTVTEGPYYLDGALFRKDITDGKPGVPLTVKLTVRDQSESCDPVSGAAVEIWHCDAWGYYSGYTTANPGGSAPAESEDTSGADDKTYLRGFQTTGDDGVVEFTTIYPGWYTPRATHIHVKVHTGGKKADNTYEGGKVNWTGQLFFDDKYGEEVYKKSPYTEHTGTRTKLDDDMVYAGGGAKDGLMTITGTVDDGFTGALTVGIDPDKENDGSGGGGEPPSGQPSGSQPSGMPSGTPSPPPDSDASASASASS
ncbi:intradiol ring-cleavage dioxygenase [Streptomyces sp. NBC_00620]|uniref:intradiol ring-cleavage dioxygenase n=1 Tax=Streptomyces sp. NBC_00620 TaxID=2903666 RepID=UPI00224F4BEC|nr:intradiol ring-cleavage dioxygenase [Streptomyces sp. NBC_00620]MCX4974697.1 intradiol ring-cleavage dioxygenase [Streptomyces sp. NBC_00620]